MQQQKNILGLLVISVLLFTLMMIPLAFGQTPSSKTGPEIFPPDSEPYGLTYGEWSAKWWQWTLPIPADKNPINDKTGEYCDLNQSGPVWFLAGTSGFPAERTCTIPEGKAVLFPIVNGQGSYVENPLIKTESELRALGKSALDQVTLVEATVDGVKLDDLKNYRVQSPLFNFTYPENNLGGVPSGPSQAVADGYWVMLHPLPVGEHTIHFKAAIADPSATNPFNFVTDVKYQLTVSGTAAQPSTNTTEQEAANATDNATSAAATNEPIMLQATSSSGNFKVQVNWTSDDIGKDNIFDLKFFDAKTGDEISNPNYSIMLFKGEQHLDKTHREDQTTPQQTYTFDEPGSYRLRIENINGSGTEDGMDIPMQVTPEFPSGVIMYLLVAALFGIITFLNSRCNFLSRLSD
jgi:hypothetical protein